MYASSVFFCYHALLENCRAFHLIPRFPNRGPDPKQGRGLNMLWSHIRMVVGRIAPLQGESQSGTSKTPRCLPSLHTHLALKEVHTNETRRLISVFFVVSCRWHRWGQDKSWWSKFGSFEKNLENRGPSRHWLRGCWCPVTTWLFRIEKIWCDHFRNGKLLREKQFSERYLWGRYAKCEVFPSFL